MCVNDYQQVEDQLCANWHMNTSFTGVQQDLTDWYALLKSRNEGDQVNPADSKLSEYTHHQITKLCHVYS